MEGLTAQQIAREVSWSRGPVSNPGTDKGRHRGHHTKAINESFELFKDAFPDGPEWQLEKSIIPQTMLAPYHEEAIKYFKEIGWWSEELQSKQDKLLADQEKIQNLWNGALEEATTNGLSGEEFTEFWMERFRSSRD